MKAYFVKDQGITVDGMPAIIPSGAERWLMSKVNNGEDAVAFVKETDVHFGYPIYSGETFTRTGRKNIVIDKNGNTKPIIRNNTYGYQSGHNSLQAYCPWDGDIILFIEWGHGEDGNTIYELKSHDEYEYYVYNFRVKPDETATNFLVPSGRGTGIIK